MLSGGCVPRSDVSLSWIPEVSIQATNIGRPSIQQSDSREACHELSVSHLQCQVRGTYHWETWNFLQSSISFHSSSREMSTRHIRQQSHKPHFRLTSLDDQPSFHIEGHVRRGARDNSKDRVGVRRHPSANYFIRYPVPAFSRPNPQLCFVLGILSALNAPVFLRSREAYKMGKRMKGIVPTKFLHDTYLIRFNRARWTRDLISIIT